MYIYIYIFNGLRPMPPTPAHGQRCSRVVVLGVCAGTLGATILTILYQLFQNCINS